MMRRFAGIAAALRLWSDCGRSARRRRSNIRAAPSPSSCPIRPAARPTRPRASSRNLSATQLKQSFIVENIGGGGAIIGAEKVARATPDGYTLLLHNLQISANVTLYKTLPFDTVKDFAPVMLVNRNPLVLVGRNTLEPNTLTELVALMKKQPMKAAIPGYGTTGHLATTLFAQEAGV